MNEYADQLAVTTNTLAFAHYDLPVGKLLVQVKEEN
jgi:hypothetical protein